MKIKNELLVKIDNCLFVKPNLKLVVIEVLFSQGKFPLGIRPTTVPENIDSYAHLNPQAKQMNGEKPLNELKTKDIIIIHLMDLGF